MCIRDRTKGGPEDATLFMVLYIYRNAFEYSKIGYASALAWVLFLINSPQVFF